MIIECPECGTKNQTSQPPQHGKTYRCGKCNAVLTFPQTPDIPSEMAKAVDKEISDEPNSVTEPSDIGQEVSVLESAPLQLLRSGEDVGENLKEELSRTNNVPAELQGQVKASPAITQDEQILDPLEELKSRLDKLEEEAQVKAQEKVKKKTGGGKWVLVVFVVVIAIIVFMYYFGYIGW